MNKLINDFIYNEDGASLAEYGILVALIAAAAIASVTGLGTKIAAVFTNITASLPAGK